MSPLLLIMGLIICYFVNTENEVIFIKTNTLDKIRVPCLLQHHVLRDVLEVARLNHLQVMKIKGKIWFAWWTKIIFFLRRS